MPPEPRASTEWGPLPEWIPFRYLLAGLSLGGMVVWITARYAGRLPQVPSVVDPMLHQAVLSVLSLAIAIQIGFSAVYLPVSQRLRARGLDAPRDTLLRVTVMFLSGMGACALVILFMFLTHGRPPTPADLEPAAASRRPREEPWRVIVEAGPILVVGGVLGVVVAEVITALSRARRRLEETTRDLTRRQTEAEVARRVQRSLLPAELPRVPGVALAARSVPAAEVGGDYYDAFTLTDGRLVIVLADVAGKGTPAALVAAALQSAVRTRIAVNDDLRSLLAQGNARFASAVDEGRFATLFVAVIDPRGPLIRYASAGHNPAILLRNSGGEVLMATGPPLGIDPGAAFEQAELEAGDGARLLVYSDGLSETMSARRELLGVERLMQAMAAGDGRPESVLRSVFAAAERWRGPAEQADDMTAIAVAIGTGHQAGSPTASAAPASPLRAPS